MIDAIARARALLAKASPGPWRNESGVIHAPLPNGGAHHPLQVHENPYFLGDPVATGDLAALAPAALAVAIALAKVAEADGHTGTGPGIALNCEGCQAIAAFEKLFPEVQQGTGRPHPPQKITKSR